MQHIPDFIITLFGEIQQFDYYDNIDWYSKYLINIEQDK